MDARLRGVFETDISMVIVRSPCDLGYENWSSPWLAVDVNYMILGLLVSTHYQHATDRQTDTPALPTSHSISMTRKSHRMPAERHRTRRCSAYAYLTLAH